ncbi:MAG: AraC family transcriptional regulator [Planctomycetota bacterium]
MKTTKARRRRQYSASSKDETLRRSWCAAIFEDPDRIADARYHRPADRFEIAPHRHSDLMQLDVICGCGGHTIRGDRRVPLHGTTLMATPPNERHGYTLIPETPDHNDTTVWLVKLRLGVADTLAGPLPLPALLTGLQPARPLCDSIASFVEEWTPRGVSAAALAGLATAISLWPTSADDQRAAPRGESADPREADSASARVRRAIETLGRNFTDPPDLEALGQAAHLSPRHFARRFRLDFGCTPHEYLAARRLDAARGLLLDPDRSVAAVADTLGFSSPAAFSRWFARLAGQSPKAFRHDPHNF